MQNDGFTTSLDALRHTATTTLPSLAAHLEATAAMADFPTDAQLLDAEAAVGAKLAEALEVLVAMDIELPSTTMVGLRECLRPTPESVLDECDRLRHAHRAHSDDVPFDVNLAAAEHQLSRWQGSAAEAFRGRLAALGSVYEQQTVALEDSLAHSAALAGLVIGIRTSYHDLATETIAAIEHEMGRIAQRNAKAFVAIGADLVISNDVQIVTGKRTLLDDPLPVSTDITSPDFRYENFARDGATPPGFAEDVAAEPGRRVAEHQTDIGRRLGGTP